ncbi:MAG TPA: hypothetical protein DCZ41_00940 [Firmicutes bacterium]|nr:hypothetical protein [Bacillota bacterium]
MSKVIAILLLAGKSERTQTKTPKQYALSKKKVPLFLETFSRLKEADFIDETFFVTPEGDMEKVQEFLKNAGINPLDYSFVEGGKTREESVYHALTKIKENPANRDSFVLIHDADRPYIKVSFLKRVIEEATKKGTAIPALRSHDSLVEIQGDSISYLPRENIYRVQTPQAFLFPPLYDAFKARKEELSFYSDDASVYLAKHQKGLFFVPGEEENIKITSREELEKWRKGK